LVLTCGAAATRGDPAASGTRALTNGVQAGQWTMDLDAAKAFAKRRQMPLLLDFSGSDWCGYCKLVDEKVFSRPEWTEYARERFVLVLIDFPENQALVPARYRERNEDLKRRLGVEGFPTFVILAPDAETVVSKFGLPSKTDPSGFLKSVGAALRNYDPERKRFLAGMGPEEAKAFEALDEELRQTRRRLEEWLAAGPQRTEANTRTFEDYQAKLAGLGAQIERIEVTRFAADFAADKAAGERNVALLAQARRYSERLRELDQARVDLEDWLLARPAKSAASQARFTDLMRRLAEARQNVLDLKLDQ
jgi:thioredoxin-related protein